MRRTARLDRRIQAGAAHLTLAVRDGEHSWDELGARIAGFEARRFVLVTDGTAPRDQLARVRALAGARAPTVLHELRARPRTTAAATDGRADADTLPGGTVIAVGGERACAVPAAVRVPTDLAAACGPALVLHRPVPAALAWVRSDRLAAGPAARTRAGLVAVVRHVLAVCPSHFPALAGLLSPGARHDARTLTALLALCADARSALVSFDPDETGPALALGYGRSLAAAVRATLGPALAPGDADALGLLLAAAVAARLGLAAGPTGRAHRDLLARNGSATALPGGADLDRLAAAAVATTRPGLLLLADLGRPYCADGRLLTRVDGAVLRAAAGDLADREDRADRADRVTVPHSRAAGTGPVARPDRGDGRPAAGREQDGTGSPCGRDGGRSTVETRSGPAGTAVQQKEFPS
ncbi:3-dehydroquinate synthase family protein [Kitasatospora purpeofusca]|uniref:3-dehydroquinate synthase family protein n=1 Tax=Kitasatospora purpeofusca TaxID=67352 RepID=UPI003F4AC629